LSQLIPSSKLSHPAACKQPGLFTAEVVLFGKDYT